MKKIRRSNKRATRKGYRRASVGEGESALMVKRMAKRETNDQNVQTIIKIIKKNPTVLEDTGVQYAFRELERGVNKFERVFKAYKDTSLFTAADFFAEIIKVRRVNKAELTPLDINLFQEAFRDFQDNFPEYLRMVADILEGKPVREDDSKVKAAYKEAFRCCNAWFFEPVDLQYSPSEYAAKVQKLLDTGVVPTMSECLAVFRKQNPSLYEPRENRPDGIAPSERSFRRSLERLGLVTRPDKRGRPKEK